MNENSDNHYMKTNNTMNLTMLSLEYVGFAMALLDGDTLSPKQAERFAYLKDLLTKEGKL